MKYKSMMGSMSHNSAEAYQPNSKGGTKTSPQKRTTNSSYKGKNRKTRETDAP